MTGTENPHVTYHHGFLHDLVIVLASELGLKSNDLRYLNQRLRSEGTGFITSALPSLGRAFDRALSVGFLVLPTHFKRKWIGSPIPAFCGAWFLRVFNRDGSLRQDADVIAVDAIRQLCFFGYKIDLPYKQELEDSVISQFLDDERDLISINRSILTKEDKVLDTCNLLITSIFDDFDRNELMFKHGPGVTSNVDFLQKYESPLTPGLPVYSQHYDDFFFNESHKYNSDRSFRFRSFDYFRNNNVAKVILVPKDARGPRLISCEPAENQWIQQGLMDYTVKKLEKHPLTSGQVNFTDQSVNQNLVLEHSHLSGKKATLDLRRASDLNSLALFLRMFSGTGDLFRSIMCSRSSQTQLPSGDIVTLQKFAPMGSALCFPVMAVTIYLLLYVHFVRLGLTPGDARKSIYVYGDDLIVPIELAEYTMLVLEEYGFKVNSDKSFIGSVSIVENFHYSINGSRFLESCGVDAFDKTVVTPVRLRKLTYTDGTLGKDQFVKNQSQQIISLIETANLLSSRKSLRRTASFIYTFVERFLGSKLPWGKEDSPYLCKYYPGKKEHLAEVNFLEDGLKWKRKKNLNRYPLGGVLLVFVVKSTQEQVKTSLYGHLSRCHRSIGNTLIPKSGGPAHMYHKIREPIPFGTFDMPRRIVLRKRYVSHYELDS